MTLAGDLAAAFALPCDPVDGLALIDVVICRDAANVLGRVASLVDGEERCGHRGLAAGLARRARLVATGCETVAWNETVGRARELLVSPAPRAVVEHAAALAAHLQGRAPFGDWSAILLTPGTLRWGNHVIDDVGCIAVSETDDGCRLSVSGSDGETVHHFDRRSKTVCGPRSREIPQLRSNGFAFDLLLHERAFGSHVADRQFGQSPNRAGDAFRPALDLARKFAPHYFNWVAGAITAIVPLVAPQHCSVSSSQARRPGTVGVCTGLDAATTLALLVHEASHQRFFVLERVCAIKKADDERLVYSPLPDAMRTIDRVAFAYHACVNIEACYRTLERNGADVAWTGTDRWRRSRDRIRSMEAALTDNAGLTEVGRALVDHLRESLHPWPSP